MSLFLSCRAVIWTFSRKPIRMRRTKTCGTHRRDRAGANSTKSTAPCSCDREHRASAISTKRSKIGSTVSPLRDRALEIRFGGLLLGDLSAACSPRPNNPLRQQLQRFCFNSDQ